MEPRAEPNGSDSRCERMTNTWRSQARRLQPSRSPGDEWETPVFWFLSVFLAGAAGFFFLLHSLGQPKIYPNPGIAAYVAPPATRLVPLPRRSTAPELADLPVVDPPSPLTAMAKAQATDQPPSPPARKRPRAEPSPNGQRGFGYTQQWDFGSRGPSNNHAWSGGPKSWF
jgi:hypothetical protein